MSFGMLKGFKNIFHCDDERLSLRNKIIKPIRTITTAVPFPFLIIVENIKETLPIKSTGNINCEVISILSTGISKIVNTTE